MGDFHVSRGGDDNRDEDFVKQNFRKWRTSSITYHLGLKLGFCFFVIRAVIMLGRKSDAILFRGMAKGP